MQEVRGSSLDQRRGMYLEDRVEEQRVWYARKARHNRRYERLLFVAVVGAQALAVAAAVILAVRPDPSFDAVGIASALAAALLAWLQVKRHQELAESYKVAATEFRFIAEEGKTIRDEEALSDFVGDAENAVSREHTLWIARRDRLMIPGASGQLPPPSFP